MAVTELVHEERWQDEDAESALRHAKREWERAMRDDTYAVLRAGYYDEAEAALLDRLTETRSTRFDLVRGARVTVPQAEVSLWIDEMVATAKADPRGGPLTAIQISLCNAGIRGTTGSAEPDIEVTGYTDQFFPFSTASDAEIDEAQRGFATPWQGSFDWFPETAHYQMQGLGAINRALLTFRNARQPELIWVGERMEVAPDAKAAPVAGLLMAVAFHRFLRDAVARTIVPHPLVVIGDGNDDVHVRAVHHRPPVDGRRR